jgi:hypothetical protein
VKGFAELRAREAGRGTAFSHLLLTQSESLPIRMPEIRRSGLLN